VASSSSSSAARSSFKRRWYSRGLIGKRPTFHVAQPEEANE
jgi:hypothetical protein